MDDLQKQLQEALHGLDYPATRSKLITVALANNSSRAVIDRLLEFPETADFVNEEQLQQALGVTVPGEHPHGWE
jgi:uncharacterized protein DUF2795